jgi:hypothetical protein
MQRPVIAIIGAGASYASGDYPVAQRPPLTTQLFGCERAAELLQLYALAQSAGDAIERDMEADSTIQFEEALRRLQNDGLPHHAQMALAIPLFLQALLLAYSEALAAHSRRYMILVDELLKLQTELCFVSLNYDTLLDQRLSAFWPLDSLERYLDSPLKWSLIKPHGSVAWYVEQPAAFNAAAPPGDLEVHVAPIECVPVSELSLERLRASNSPHGRTTRYPAIALPDGPKDRLVLPPAHRQHLQSLLHRSQEIDLLVLGYSALDTEVLQLIKDGECLVRRFTVVNASPSAALEVYRRVTDFGIEPVYNDTFDGSFETWVDGKGLRQWVADYGNRFEFLTAPQELELRIAQREQERRDRLSEQRPSLMDQQF